MKRKLGIFLMILGMLLLTGAAGLFVWNEQQAERAASASAELMPKLSAAIEEYARENPVRPLPLPMEPEKPTMKTMQIDGRDYVGYLTIPKLGLQLPIIAEWSDANLKIAPCRYTGTTMEENMVLVAHNYKKHFGPIRRLKPGDQVIFVDMENLTTVYEVAATDAVAPTAVEEVTAGAYDLALVTCTYGGNTRLVVYCDVYNPEEGT